MLIDWTKKDYKNLKIKLIISMYKRYKEEDV